MSCSFQPPDQTAYQTGRVSGTQSCSSHPGGLSLTFHALDLAALQPGAVILDLGCGSGGTMNLLSSQGYQAIGLDPLPDEIDQVDGVRICGSAENLPFRDHSVDGVLAECSFSVVEDQERVLEECSRVCRPGGRLIISDLYAREPEAIATVRSLAKSCVSGMIIREELEARLLAKGFTLNVWEDHTPALREFVARILMEHGSLEMLWQCDGSNASGMEIQSAMRAVKAGYFLLIATRNSYKGEPYE